MGALLCGGLFESAADGGGLLKLKQMFQWLLLWLVNLIDGWLAFLLNG